MNPLKNFKSDIPAGIVVFLVALPLSLGIAMASGAPLYSGIIAGVIGGIVVGALSGSPLGVSGPAAGLAVIVLNAITDLGGFEILLVAVVISGILQLIFGFARAGIVAYYFPSAVIHGMLAGIGITIFLKQVPHAFGYDIDPEGDLSFFQVDGENTFSEILKMADYIHPGVVIVTAVSLFILILWETKPFKKMKWTKVLSAPLLVVIIGILFNKVFATIPHLRIETEHLVTLPVITSMDEFLGNFTFPDFSALGNSKVYIAAIVIAVVGSLETLLSVEAIDKQDPYRRITPTNRELKAQGVGNILSGLIGGLPVTQVIVRSSVNQQTGGKTKTSTIVHGVMMLVSVLAIPGVLNMIPLSSLAAILLTVGYKLARHELFKRMNRQGKGQFISFVVTLLAIVFTDLLIGIGLGMVVAISIILYNNYRVPYQLIKESLEGRNKIKIILSEDVTFLNKASILKSLEQIPDNTVVEIDASNTRFIHPDVSEIIEDFIINARSRNIGVATIDLYKNKRPEPLQHFKVTGNEE